MFSVWKTTDAPKYLIGYNWTIALDVSMVAMLFVLSWFWNREQREARAADKTSDGIVDPEKSAV
jgi:hypothetical protein